MGEFVPLTAPRTGGMPPTGVATPDTLVVWGLRRMHHLGGRSPGVHATTCTALGPKAGPAAYAGMRSLLAVCARSQRRPLRITPPGIGAERPSLDEYLLLQLVAACQWERPALRDATLDWLLRRDAHKAGADAAGEIAGALSRGGLLLSEPAPGAACERLDRVAAGG